MNTYTYECIDGRCIYIDRYVGIYIYLPLIHKHMHTHTDTHTHTYIWQLYVYIGGRKQVEVIMKGGGNTKTNPSQFFSFDVCVTTYKLLSCVMYALTQ
jgi:hypothetical protein